MAGRPVSRARRQAEGEALVAAVEVDLPDSVEVDELAPGRVVYCRGPVSVAVDEAIEGMTWLSDADRALVALARSYAGLIDGMRTVNVTQGLGLRLEQVLLKLGGAPAERAAIKNLGGEGDSKQGRLGQLRLAHGGAGAAGPAAGRRKAGRSA